MVDYVQIGKLVRKTKQVNPDDLGRDYFIYLDISSIDRELKIISEAQYLPVGEAPSRARKSIENNDILVSTVRPNLNAVALVTKEYHQEIASTGFCVLRPIPECLDERYLFYLTQTSDFVDYLVRIATGASYPAVSDNDILRFEIPLPPLDEQKRIAAILEEADHARRTRRYTQSLSDTFLQEVFVEMFGDPVTNPMGWEEIEFGKYLERIESGWSPVCEDRVRVSDEWAVLSLGSISWGVFAPEENKLLPKDLHPRPEIEVKAGDLLFVRKNTYDLVGNVTYVFETPPHLMLSDTIFRFRFKADSGLEPIYVWGLLNHVEFKKQKVRVLASGTAGSMPNISKERLQTVVFPCPPPLKQKQFAETVEHYEQVNNQQHESARQAEHLFQSLLHRAFRGEL